MKKSVQNAAEKYAKPDEYTGSRGLYDSSIAKRQAKTKLFNSDTEVVDPYTKEKLVLTKNEAKALYREDWQKHLAESDHIKPLEDIYKDTRGSAWLTTDDVKAAANSDDNIQVVSRQFNNAKRSKTNKEYVEDEAYLADKGIRLTEGGKEAALKDGEIAERSINRQLKISSAKNLVKTGHDAGMATAKTAGQMTAVISGINNMVAVIKGEKDAGEAIVDTLEDGGKATITGYAMGNGLTTLSHTLSNASSKFIQALSNSNIPGKVITAVITTGDTFKRWENGEITTEECFIELGEKGLNLATAGYSIMVGQSLIPIPIVGAAVGAIVGSVLTGSYYHQLIGTLKRKELEHQERMRIIEECNRAAEQARAYRDELEYYMRSCLKEYKDCFDEAWSEIGFAYQTGNADGMIAGANKITKKYGGQVYYETVEEFKNFLDDDSVDIL